MLIPHQYEPREYQRPFYNCLANGFLRGVAIWHRRAGKDITAFNLTIKESFLRPGVYWIVFPTYAMGRKIIWDGFDQEGRRFLTYLPEGTRTNDQEMKAYLPWGSLIQIIGTDKFDRVVGPNPFGVIFSEYSLQNPLAWKLIIPILLENKGWALFLYTPRGQNHGYDMFKRAKKSPHWFFSFLTVRDTKREDGRTPVITEADIEQEREDGMSEDMVQQEFYCSFEMGIEGSYYGKLMIMVERQGRIIPNLYDPAAEVKTAWDLGVGDACAIWFFQTIRNEIRLIDYHEDVGKGIIDYAQVLEDKRQQYRYNYTAHFAPHDVEHRGKFTGKSLREQAAEIGLEFIPVPRDTLITTGIEATRAILPRCWFDEEKTEAGRDALSNYRKHYDPKLRAYSNIPLHDWSSNGADAFRTIASAIRNDLVEGGTLTVAEVRRMQAMYGPGRYAQQSGPLDG